MTRRIAAFGIGFIFLVLVFVLFRGQGVEVVGNLPRKDVAEICRVVSKAEVAMEQPQFPPGLPRLSLFMPPGLRAPGQSDVVAVGEVRETRESRLS